MSLIVLFFVLFMFIGFIVSLVEFIKVKIEFKRFEDRREQLYNIHRNTRKAAMSFVDEIMKTIEKSHDSKKDELFYKIEEGQFNMRLLLDSDNDHSEFMQTFKLWAKNVETYKEINNLKL